MIKKILYLSDYQLIIYHLEAKVFTKYCTLLNDNIVDLISYLENYDKTPLVILVDTAQEEYQIVLLPHVLGKDRQDQFNHKMQRLFERTPYRCATLQGREKNGRGDDRVLFSALNNQENLTSILNILMEYKIPIIGIYSVALLSQQLLKYFSLPLAQQNYLLLVNHTPPISAHSLQGLRQTFFINQQFQLSRLIPLNITQPVEYTDYIVNQITRTQQYLHSKRLLPANATLSVLIITHTDYLPHLMSKFDQSLNIKLYLVDIKQLNSIKLTATEDYYLPYLLADLLSKQIPKNHYAKLAEKRYFVFNRLRMILYGISVSSLSGAIVVSYLFWQQTQQLIQQSQSLDREIQQQQTVLTQRRATIPTLPIDLAHFRNVVESGQYIIAQHIHHQIIWEKISQVLVQYPNLLPTELKWGIGNSAQEIFTTTSKTETEQDEVDAVSSASVYPPDKIDSTEATDQFIEGVRLRGKISPFDGNYRVALKLYNDFVIDLQRQEATWQIEKSQPPYDTKSRQGQIGTQVDLKEAPFAVEILVKHDYD